MLAIDVKEALVAVHHAGDVLPNANSSCVVRPIQSICGCAGVSGIKGEGAIGQARTVDVVPKKNGIVAIAGAAEDSGVVCIACESGPVEVYPRGDGEVSIGVNTPELGYLRIVSRSVEVQGFPEFPGGQVRVASQERSVMCYPYVTNR